MENRTNAQSPTDALRARSGADETIAVIDPVTEEQLAQSPTKGLPPSTPPSPGLGIVRWSLAWQHLPHSDRAKVLWKVAELLEARHGELAGLDSLNIGMLLAQHRHAPRPS